MGLSDDAITALSSQVWGWSDASMKKERVAAAGLSLQDFRIQQTLFLIEEIIGFPRHLSQHVGGFVITRGRLDELVPVENAAMEDRTVIEWDKDDIDVLGMLKSRRAFSRHAHLYTKGVRSHQGMERHVLQPRDHPTRRPAYL